MSISECEVTLIYAIQRGDGASINGRDTVALDRTPCTRGGDRIWFLCPGCDRRVRALYLAPGQDHFRCWHCRRLAYGSQQVAPAERHLMAIRNIQRQLGADPQEPFPWVFPPKPKGMHWRAYERLRCALCEHEMAPEAILFEQMKRLLARSERTLGVQLEADVVAFPLHEERYEPLFAAMEGLDATVWLHPYRSPASPSLPQEMAPLLLWQVFGWTVDTTLTVMRLIFAGIYDRHPRLKLLAHHGGGLIPHFSGRVAQMAGFTGLDTSLAAALGRLQQEPLAYCRMLYADTALFGAGHSVASVVGFFGVERVLFGSDTPYDMQGGARFIAVTIADVEGAVPDAAARARIFEENAHRILGIRA
jgi:predicted TIM-barrel fold metal-dependent hydrolase